MFFPQDMVIIGFDPFPYMFGGQLFKPQPGVNNFIHSEECWRTHVFFGGWLSSIQSQKPYAMIPAPNGAKKNMIPPCSSHRSMAL